jgi:hypothetical protein
VRARLGYHLAASQLFASLFQSGHVACGEVNTNGSVLNVKDLKQSCMEADLLDASRIIRNSHFFDDFGSFLPLQKRTNKFRGDYLR